MAYFVVLFIVPLWVEGWRTPLGAAVLRGGQSAVLLLSGRVMRKSSRILARQRGPKTLEGELQGSPLCLPAPPTAGAARRVRLRSRAARTPDGESRRGAARLRGPSSSCRGPCQTPRSPQ